ncbi:hypothetical protein KM043_010821 [Ampulex compressa]|nr:hypothetical protein KM043_010821 [Ampulex compressa]
MVHVSHESALLATIQTTLRSDDVETSQGPALVVSPFDDTKVGGLLGWKIDSELLKPDSGIGMPLATRKPPASLHRRCPSLENASEASKGRKDGRKAEAFEGCFWSCLAKEENSSACRGCWRHF